MALVCFKCSAENVDGALVCRHCGAALPPPSWARSLLPEDDQFDPLNAPTLVMRHTAPAPLPPIEETAVPMPERKSGSTLLLGLATGVLIVAAGAWLLRPADEAPSTAAPSGPETQASAAAAPPPAAPAAASQAPAAASTPLSPAVAEIASMPVAAVAAAASAAPASAAQAAAPASAADTRKRIPAPVARKRALSSVPAAAPPASASPPLPATPAELTAAPSAPPVVPARPQTVSELCAGGNLITRGFCEQRECRRPEVAADPLCVKLKDAEQRRLFQQ